MKKINSEEEIVESQNFYEGRNFYIFGYINDTFPKDIIQPFINEITIQSGLKNPKPINVYITSGGGHVDYTFDLVSWIEYGKKNGVEINTYVTSYAASGANIIAVTGTNRYVGARCSQLMHYMRSESYSISPEMSKRNHEQDLFWQDQILKHYKKYTKVKNIEKELITDNFYINGGDELIKNGLADYII